MDVEGQTHCIFSIFTSSPHCAVDIVQASTSNTFDTLLAEGGGWGGGGGAVITATNALAKIARRIKRLLHCMITDYCYGVRKGSLRVVTCRQERFTF